MIPTPEFTNSLDTDRMDVGSSLSNCLNEEPNYVNPPSNNAKKLNVEIDNYAGLEDTRWTKTDYQQLNG